MIFATVADHFLSVRTNGGKNATFSQFPHNLVQSVYALHKNGAFSLSQHVLWPYPSRNLDVARDIYNYRLTQAKRMMACASFGIVCNKWRIFHHAIDICPDFCDVIVKTCCKLHNFVRQRDRRLQFQDNLYECPLESIKAVGNRGDVTGTDMRRRARGRGITLCRSPTGEPDKGLVYRGLKCRRRLWRWAPLSIGALLGHMGGTYSPGTLIVQGGLWK